MIEIMVSFTCNVNDPILAEHFLKQIPVQMIGSQITASRQIPNIHQNIKLLHIFPLIQRWRKIPHPPLMAGRQPLDIIDDSAPYDRFLSDYSARSTGMPASTEAMANSGS